MPDQNQPDPNQNASAAPVATPADQPAIPSGFSPTADLPPIPPAFQNVGANPAGDSGSAAPPTIPPIISTPKKKFGTGRIIATILGLLLLVGGIGAGIVLTQQQQLFQQKAAGGGCGYCNSKNKCVRCTKPGVISQGDCASDSDCSAGPGGGAGGVGSGGGGRATGEAEGGGGGGGGGGATTTTICNGGNPPCKQPGESCTDTIECPDGYGCSKTTNTCTSSGQEGSACSATSPCADSTFTCSAGRCVKASNTGDAGSSCFVDGNCNSGLVCSGGVCARGGNGASCSGAGANCGNGYICTNGTCQPNTSGSCKIGDSGAPVCCTDTSCAGGTKVCEAPARYECNVNGIHCTIETNSANCKGANAGGGGGGGSPVGQCLNVKAYSTSWSLLSNTELSALTSGTTINFCVAGSATSGAFDKAQFKIGATLEPETTTKRPSSNDFCQSYTIAPTDTSVSVKAKIHNTDASVGWVGESI